jgi:predicted DNA-binding protein
MSKTITIRLDDDLAETLDHVSNRTGRSKSEIMRDALKRRLSIELLDLAREKLVPLARRQGIYTDEDVFELLKRNPETGVIQCLEREGENT